MRQLTRSCVKIEFRSLKAVEKGGAKKQNLGSEQKSAKGQAFLVFCDRLFLDRGAELEEGRDLGFVAARTRDERRGKGEGDGRAVIAPSLEHPYFSPSWVGTWEIMGVAVGCH